MSGDLELRIGKLRLEPGDILVVKCHSVISQEQAYRLRQHMEGFASPSTKILVIDSSCDLSVLTAAEIESRA